MKCACDITQKTRPCFSTQPTRKGSVQGLQRNASQECPAVLTGPELGRFHAHARQYIRVSLGKYYLRHEPPLFPLKTSRCNFCLRTSVLPSLPQDFLLALRFCLTCSVVSDSLQPRAAAGRASLPATNSRSLLCACPQTLHFFCWDFPQTVLRCLTVPSVHTLLSKSKERKSNRERERDRSKERELDREKRHQSGRDRLTRKS